LKNRYLHFAVLKTNDPTHKILRDQFGLSRTALEYHLGTLP